MQDLLAGNLYHKRVEDERCLGAVSGVPGMQGPEGQRGGRAGSGAHPHHPAIHVVALHLRLRGLPPDPVAPWHGCSVTPSPLPSQKLCSAPGFFETLFEGTLRTALRLSDSMLPYNLDWITEITKRSGSLLKNTDLWV